MDGNAAGSELVATASESYLSGGKAQFRVANSDDEAALRQLLRVNPMQGDISLSLEREPNYFAAAEIEGADHQTIVATENGQVVCVGSISTRHRYLNGLSTPVGYLSGLRLDADCRNRMSILRGGYGLFKQLHERKQSNPSAVEAWPSIYLTSIVSDNLPARRLLERGLPGMPTYAFLGELVTLVIRSRRSNRPSSRLRTRLECGSIASSGEILHLLDAEPNRGQFAPVWSADGFSSFKRFGLEPEHFRIARSFGGQPLACAALWDQQAFKQTVVRGYSGRLRRLRPLINAFAACAGRPRLPLVGQAISHAYVSHMAGLDDPAMLDEMLRLLAGDAQARSIDYLTLGLDARDPRLPHLLGWSPRAYRSRLYAVHWDEAGRDLVQSLDGRLFAGGGAAMTRSSIIDQTLVPTTSRLVRRADLLPDDVLAMYRLLHAHFEGVQLDQFQRDLQEKNWAVLIERGGRLVGFTTLLAYETRVDGAAPQGRPGLVSVIYSGDTIVAPEAWNTPSLPRAWIESVAALRKHFPCGLFFWLLITSGFRTYRFLPLFWKTFYPKHDVQMPENRKHLLDQLAFERFGDAYNAVTGVVRLGAPQQLRGDLAIVPPGRVQDPHIAFFMKRNLGHAAGDELVCLTELAPQNLTAAGRRMAAAVPYW